MIVFIGVFGFFHRKYSSKYLENKQKMEKSAFFLKKKCLSACFSYKKQIFFVILRPN